MKYSAILLLCSIIPCGIVTAGDTPGTVSQKPTSGRFVKTDRGFLVPYEVKIPGTDVSFHMEPIPGGRFVMGSPDGEKGRNDVEGPQREFQVELHVQLLSTLAARSQHNFQQKNRHIPLLH